MTTVENQKTVTTKGAKHDKENIYAKLNIDAMQTAMMMLKPNTFKLWCYMAKNQNNYTFALSAVDACRFCNFSKNTYHTAVQELIEVGYLVNTGANNYDFWEEIQEYDVPIVTIRKNEDEEYC